MVLKMKLEILKVEYQILLMEQVKILDCNK